MLDERAGDADPVAILDTPIGADEIIDQPGVITGFRIYFATHTIYEYVLYGDCDIHDLAAVRYTIPPAAMLAGFAWGESEGQDALTVRWVVPDVLDEAQARAELAALETAYENTDTQGVAVRALGKMPAWLSSSLVTLTMLVAIIGHRRLDDVAAWLIPG